MKKYLSAFISALSLGWAFLCFGGHILPEKIEYSGPIAVNTPWMMDSLDVNNKSFSLESLLDLPYSRPSKTQSLSDTVLILGGKEPQLHYFSFPLQNSRFADVKMEIAGTDNYKLFLDGKEMPENFKLKPETRQMAIRILTLPNTSDTIHISLSSPQSEYISTEEPAEGRLITLDDILFSRHFNGVTVSPMGNYAILSESVVTPDLQTKNSYRLIDLKKGKPAGLIEEGYQWLGGKDVLWHTVTTPDSTLDIYILDPATWEESIFAKGVPAGDFIISPEGKRLLYTVTSEGRSEDPDVFRIITPEDRQKGWRNRTGIAVYDIEEGTYRPLTFGNKNIFIADVSQSGDKLLLMGMRNRFEKRPTTVYSLFEYDLKNNKVDTLVLNDGFISGSCYSPDAKKIIISGSPESLGGIGKNLPEGRIPNMTEGELFLMDLATGKISPLTKDFNPSTQKVEWPRKSEKLFFLAEDKDKVSLFSLNPSTGEILNMNSPEEIVKDFSVDESGTRGLLIGESATNPEILYGLSATKNGYGYKEIEAPGRQLISEINLPEVIDWDFVNSIGDTINGRFYLPPNFDPDAKYPMIVNYYGGCSPTSRNFATRYPHHLYASQGYVVYVINPSGATGFGQEFASRHVNTAGEGVARDIIEGTTKFVEEHPFVNKDKIGCIGASYGGFMSQYLQTVTDIFAAAISHAGISDHTSYWGNGYWGYSYSEVSMAESYPWTNPDLFVKQSPLYNAHKINTPILFVHGEKDTNVPAAESVQLFTALTLLGKDTALVEVADQDHWILDIEKRRKWQDTIFAWFAKYLQDDPGWWDALYPPTPLEAK